MSLLPEKYHRFYALMVLSAIYTMSFVDRQLIAIASPILKEELAISDTQLGLLKGFAFTILYSLVGFPIARLADRSSRVNIISVSLAFWSVMTALTGLANNFLHLILVRAGLGLGEAGCTPPAHSLLSDYFSKGRLHSALSIYSLGIPIGNMIAFLLGGFLLAEVGWRITFIIFGVVGLVLAMIFKLTVEEPSRTFVQIDAHMSPSKKNRPTFRHDIALLLKIPSYRALCIGSGFVVFGAFGLVSWIVDLFVRNHQLNLTDIGLHLAFIYGIGGSTGMLLSGYLCDKLGQKNKVVYLMIPGSALILSSPFLATAIWSPESYLAYFFLGFSVLLIHFYQGPIYALAQMLAPSQLRAQAAAFIIFIQIFAGVGIGPLVIGGLSDALTPLYGIGVALSIAMSSLCIALIFAGLVFLTSAKKLLNDLK